MVVEPPAADPEDIARKLAANPNLKVPPAPQWVLNAEGGGASFRKG